tara:strand:- start:571 stop:1347 length:777 start_codon:yes stop_codon:yes gene_type:complete
MSSKCSLNDNEANVLKKNEPVFLTKKSSIKKECYEICFIEILDTCVCVETGRRGGTGRCEITFLKPGMCLGELKFNSTNLTDLASELLYMKKRDGFLENNILKNNYIDSYKDNKLIDISECGGISKRIRQNCAKRLQLMLAKAKADREREYRERSQWGVEAESDEDLQSVDYNNEALWGGESSDSDNEGWEWDGAEGGEVKSNTASLHGGLTPSKTHNPADTSCVAPLGTQGSYGMVSTKDLFDSSDNDSNCSADSFE